MNYLKIIKNSGNYCHTLKVEFVLLVIKYEN